MRIDFDERKYTCNNDDPTPDSAQEYVPIQKESEEASEALKAIPDGLA